MVADRLPYSTSRFTTGVASPASVRAVSTSPTNSPR